MKKILICLLLFMIFTYTLADNKNSVEVSSSATAVSNKIINSTTTTSYIESSRINENQKNIEEKMGEKVTYDESENNEKTYTESGAIVRW